MEDEIEKKDGYEGQGKEDVFSNAVRAGKRTYFFDVKATRRNDYYLTITESKKRFNKDGRFFYEKHKIFLYKEDFEKFIEGLTGAIGFIQTSSPQQLIDEPVSYEENELAENYTNLEFDDLDKAVE
ncbi:MAG: PUR family DNA/RNA-binding protein [Bacteroidales bacterium]|nr:PUR family DNA/RNA-binding protein [Bacteroidales bacterium]